MLNTFSEYPNEVTDFFVNKETNDNGTEQFWTTHRDKFPSNDKNTDISCLMDEEVSISPIVPNFSNEVSIKEITQWIEQWG